MPNTQPPENFIHRMIRDGEPIYLEGNHVLDLVANRSITPAVNANGKELRNLYHFTPHYAKHVQRMIGEITAISGMVPEHVEHIIATSIANNALIITRPVNPDARRLLEAGALGKPLSLKAKSSEGTHAAPGFTDPTAGYIPYDQSLSKLGMRDVPSYQEKVHQTVEEKSATSIHLTTKQNGQDILHYYVKNGDGNCDFVYKKNDAPGYYRNNNGTEESYNAEGKAVQELRVLGKGKRPFTADIDILLYATQSKTTTAQDHAPLTGKDITQKWGIITPTEQALAVALEHATKGATSHGADNRNPTSSLDQLHDDLARGVMVFNPNGKISIIRNKTKPQLAERTLVGIFNKLKARYTANTNPLWNWSERAPERVLTPEKSPSPVLYTKDALRSERDSLTPVATDKRNSATSDLVVEGRRSSLTERPTTSKPWAGRMAIPSGAPSHS